MNALTAQSADFAVDRRQIEEIPWRVRRCELGIHEYRRPFAHTDLAEEIIPLVFLEPVSKPWLIEDGDPSAVAGVVLNGAMKKGQVPPNMPDCPFFCNHCFNRHRLIRLFGQRRPFGAVDISSRSVGEEIADGLDAVGTKGRFPFRSDSGDLPNGIL